MLFLNIYEYNIESEHIFLLKTFGFKSSMFKISVLIQIYFFLIFLSMYKKIVVI